MFWFDSILNYRGHIVRSRFVAIALLYMREASQAGQRLEQRHILVWPCGYPRPTLGFELPTLIPLDVNAAGRIGFALGLDRPDPTLSLSVSLAGAL